MIFNNKAYNNQLYKILEFFVEDESILVMLIQQYASKFGITFSSSHLDDPEKKAKLVSLIQQALAGERGPISDSDLD